MRTPRRWSTAVTAALLLGTGSCEKPAPAAPAPKPASPPATVPTTSARGKVTGTVRYEGATPRMTRINTASDPACEGAASAEPAIAVHDGLLENVLVRIKGPVAGEPAPKPQGPVVLDQKACAYVPRVQGALAGQAIEVHNSDPTLHGVRVLQGPDSVLQEVQPPQGPPVKGEVPRAAEVLRVKCDVHPWMLAWIVVSPSAHFAVTDAAGHFALEGLPPGTYTVEAWHESLGTRSAEVKVAADGATELSFTFSAG
ncbi:TonB-dependent receptor [Aggregicoccus sp. 17bor-14]|uniref:carboxypeptidase regulatory-like domain-containing protein n=1 Tax=Myxococcaceae TaxID=31 RepID=UPI00129CB272|nr:MULTISPECIES: carboxypeptidase regulatory-like domain-containing protein [Myxococcaceae]MBF5042704.1 carboxypeptidase regulatory-like domain-containing protein [Simulacricoccus sp. 17bor-14]MRI88472.1 TonB-dependent receptor [Aggregicoccus sp. 17bor-14]